MVRYLLYFSYLGTYFNGMQRQAPRGLRNPGVITVSDVIEAGLKKLSSKNDPVLCPSSRTDSGVHALMSTAHFDLQHSVPGKFHAPESITLCLNQHFLNGNYDVRAMKTVVVPENFCARRNAKRRTYVFRIAVNRSTPHTATHFTDSLSPFKRMDFPQFKVLPSLMEHDMSYHVGLPFDHNAMIKASRLFLGTHNFLTFSKKEHIRNPIYLPRNPVRCMEVCDVSPGHGILSNHDPYQKDVEYWDVTLTSSGFLQRQVRRMVGALIAVGRGKITEADIKKMLENPATEAYDRRIGPTPAHALFLKNIEYNSEDLILPPDYFEVIEKYKSSYTFKRIIESERLLNLISERYNQLEKKENLSVT